MIKLISLVECCFAIILTGVVLSIGTNLAYWITYLRVQNLSFILFVLIQLLAIMKYFQPSLKL